MGFTMGFTLRGRRISAWIACFAILLASLAPSISHAIEAASKTGSLDEICTVAGLKTVTAVPADSPAQKQLHFEHCPFCATHAGSFALPPPADLTLPVVSVFPAYPSLFYQAPHPFFVWTTAQSRAPPLHS
jgi:hypothetical protein